MRTAILDEAELAETIAPAVDAILGANPFVGIDPSQAFSALGDFFSRLSAHPGKVTQGMLQLGTDLFKIGLGISEVAPEPSDKRFSDPAWNDNVFYRRLMQTYLAWRQMTLDLAKDDVAENGHWKVAAQERFSISLLTEALAPTNLLAGNPAALKRAFETGGMSLVTGLRNYVEDLWNNGGMPAVVDKRPFKVGVNIAATPGEVVYRGELCEIIQYIPTTRQVYQRPVLLVPPQINKYYVMDLAPNRSLIEYSIARGIQCFTISWRNPGPEHRNWGLDNYVGAIKDALAVVSEITGSADVNLLAICAGGITSSLAIGHLAAAGNRLVNSGTLLVTMLDSSEPSMTGMFTTAETVRSATAKSAAKGVLDAASIARVFAWLRPNDLVWNYWVNNYLMGKEPAAFDLLFWNADSTNLPAKLHAGFLDILLRNPLVEADKVAILGTPINLRSVTNDMYILAGMTDHICSWRACHRAARLFGGHVEFVLNSSGHVQSLVNPPGNFKAKYFTNPRLGVDPDLWVKGATEHKGTWWDHWLEWIEKRSGEKRAAPETLGSVHYMPIEPAPGTYVHQRP
jgi:poly[(R)-3-hydroxyalkanoate] polymerase subunit PhaC